MNTKINATLFDLDELINYDMSTLLKLYNICTKAEKAAEIIKEDARYVGQIMSAVFIEQQLYFINANIEIIEVALLMKEGDIFEFSDYGQICLN